MVETGIAILIAVIVVTATLIRLIVLSIFCCCCGLFMMLPSSKLSDPMPIIKRLLPASYKIETHTCTTPDGYILSLTRVSNPDVSPKPH